MSSAMSMVGIGINVVGNVAINLGTVLIKRAHMAKTKASPPLGLLVGYAAFVVGNALNFASMSLAPQSLLAALGSVQFLSNVLFSRLLLHAPVPRRVLVATIAIIAANTLIVVPAQTHHDNNRVLSADQLMLLSVRPAYLVYLATVVTLAMVAHFVYLRTRTCAIQLRDSDDPWNPRGARLSESSQDATRRAQEQDTVRSSPVPPPSTQELPRNATHGRHAMAARDASHGRPRGNKTCARQHTVEAVSFAVSSALIGSQSVTFAKSCSLLLRDTLEGNSQLGEPFTYAVAAAWLAAMVFWMKRMNAALRLFDAIFIIPTLQVAWTLNSIIGGGVFFEEFDGYSVTDAAMLGCGVAGVLAGICLLTPSQHGRTIMDPVSEVLGVPDDELLVDLSVHTRRNVSAAVELADVVEHMAALESVAHEQQHVLTSPSTDGQAASCAVLPTSAAVDSRTSDSDSLDECLTPRNDSLSTDKLSSPFV